MNNENQQPATKADLAQLSAELRASQERAVETLAGEISRSREEVRNRVDGVERRLNTFADLLFTINANLTTLSNNLAKAIDRIDRDQTETRATQIAQQHAIDEIFRRLSSSQ